MDVTKYVKLEDGKMVIDIKSYVITELAPKLKAKAAESDTKFDDALVDGFISLLEKL